MKKYFDKFISSLALYRKKDQLIYTGLVEFIQAEIQWVKK